MISSWAQRACRDATVYMIDGQQTYSGLCHIRTGRTLGCVKPHL